MLVSAVSLGHGTWYNRGGAWVQSGKMSFVAGFCYARADLDFAGRLGCGVARLRGNRRPVVGRCRNSEGIRFTPAWFAIIPLGLDCSCPSDENGTFRG